MTLTPELFKKALAEAGEMCSENCVFAEPAAANMSELLRAVFHAHSRAAGMGLPPEVGTFYEGLHVGYRLAKLEDGAAKEIKPTIDADPVAVN